MKKFLTYVAMQPSGSLLKLQYKGVDNDELLCNRKVCFPISLLVNSFVKEGEEAEVICMLEENNSDASRNYQELEREISDIVRDKGVHVHMKTLMVSKEENAKAHLDIFSKLVECVENDDEWHVCMTYGTKPVPIIEMMAMNYAYSLKDNVTMKCAVYGKVNREKNEVKDAVLYDVSALFYMDQLVNNLASNNIKKPEEVIRSILNIGD